MVWKKCNKILANFYISIAKKGVECCCWKDRWPRSAENIWKINRDKCSFNKKAELEPNYVSQWSKWWKVFQRGAGPNFHKFPLETNLVMVKYQKLAKSVERNWGFWINFDFKNVWFLFGGFILRFMQMAFWNYWHHLLYFPNLWVLNCEQ